jgi:AMMECR1 domain-containing protein
MALAAVFHDSVFPALSPWGEILDIQRIETGRHSLYTVRVLRLGLLPQAASGHRWDRLTFLAETVINLPLHLKLGRIRGQGKGFIFSAEIFREDDREHWPFGKKLKNILTNKHIIISIPCFCSRRFFLPGWRRCVSPDNYF